MLPRLRNFSRAAELASSFWFAHDNSTRWLIIQRHGPQRAIDIETYFLAKHQETHFIDGSTKLGIIDDRHHELAAKYHCLSNLMGGLDTGYVPDQGDGKAWVFYFPPQASVGGPFLPSPATRSLPFDMMVPFFTWHARNGAYLGNDRLYFTLTDHIMAGGPYDAGYFAEADRPLAPEETLVVELGTTSVNPGRPPELGITEWPQARKDAALQKYSAEYCLGGFAQTTLVLGEAETVEIAELSHLTNVVAWCRPLMVEFACSGRTDSERFADLFEKTFRLIGDEFERVQEGPHTLLRHTRTRLSAPQYPGWATPPRAIEEAFARAWGTASRAVGSPVSVTVEQSRSEGHPHTVWRFSPSTLAQTVDPHAKRKVINPEAPNLEQVASYGG